MIHCKVVIVGDTGVGKTSIGITYTSNQFPLKPPSYFDSYNANVIVEGRPTQMSIWDTAGSSDYDRLRPLTYVSSDVIIIAYSVGDGTSFANVADKWVPEITRHCPTAPYVLLATKVDLRKEVGPQCITTAQGEELARQIDAVGYFEVSAKEYFGLYEAMNGALKAGIGEYRYVSEPHLPRKPDPPVITNGADVCDELSLLVNEKLFHDVVFRVKDESIYCHKFVLCSACPSLHKLITQHEPIGNYFTSSMSDNNNNDVCVVSVSEVSHVELLEFIKFVYNGKAKQSPTNEFIQLAKACDIDYTVDRRGQLKRSIAASIKTMHDIEVITSDKKVLPTIKALLWCRSEYFMSLLSNGSMGQIAVDKHSTLMVPFLNYLSEGILPRQDLDEEFLDLAKWSLSMTQSIECYLVESVINVKNVIHWTNLSRDRFPTIYAYCIWFMRVNCSELRAKESFLALRESPDIWSNWWPGDAYEYRYKKWQGNNGKKKDRCTVQ